MPIDKQTLSKLKKFADVFKAARDRNADESNTVMFLIKFFDEVLGFDPLAGEITTEIPIKDRYCDFAIVLDGKSDDGKPKPEFLVEARPRTSKFSMRNTSNRRRIMLNAPPSTGCC